MHKSSNDDNETGTPLPQVPALESTDKIGLTDIKFNPLEYSKTLLRDPRFLSDMTFWHQHMPFAHVLVQMHKPKMFVELGTHYGDSYLAFCQAIDSLGLNAKCYAVDTWEGDQHTGTYDISVYEELKAYHDPLYGRFSALIKSTFDQAVDHFSDGSIDLLHIDGTHTYETVKHDFETWLPKMSERGIVLFHDINVRERDFGVWRLWEELKTKYPGFEFMHSCGLGVLAVGSKIPESIKEFFATTGEAAAVLSGFFQMLGARVSLQHTVKRQGIRLADRDRRIAEIERVVGERDRRIAEIEHLLKCKEAHTKELEGVVGERDRRIAEIEHLLKCKEAHTKELEGVVGERDRRIAELEHLLKCKEAHTKELEAVVGERDRYINLIHSGHGWRLLNKYFRLRDRLLPTNTRRRLLIKLFFRTMFMSPKGILSNMNKAVLNKFIHHFMASEPKELEKRIERKLNETAEIKNESKNDLKNKTKQSQESQDSAATNYQYHTYLGDLNYSKSPEYVSLSKPELPQCDIKVIAFYLPQFHPISENNEWWGKGFTEWTNVTKAVPQFIGHYQPRLPGELGFYDLRLHEVMERQIELAKMYGIYGFCFYHYWFGGKKLLRRPLENFLANKGLDFRFCLCWANESWTRTWDGYEKHVLIAQKHSPEDDIEFIKDVTPALKDERYIRVDGKPLLIVYRPGLLPDARATAERWRKYCRENGIGEIHLATTFSFDRKAPEKYGFDAAIEFPPNNTPAPIITNQMRIINPDYKGIVYDYRSFVQSGRNYQKPDYTLYKTVFPSWDNEARRPGRGATYAFSSPALYAEWLRNVCDYTTKNLEPQNQMVFVNAWNEWAEGAYLEPDRKYGYAYLDKTAAVIASFSKKYTETSGKWKILFVSHDACRGGAQSVLLDIISWFKKYTSIEIKILCLDTGEWLPRFRELGDTHVFSTLKENARSGEELLNYLLEFCGGRPDLIYGNSMAVSREYKQLQLLDAPIITHVHELETSIKRYAAN